MSRVRWFVILIVVVAAWTAPAGAHPLGNFTINHLARASVRGQAIRIHYVLDIAEIPSFQIMHGSAWGGNGAKWSASESSVVVNGLSISADGSPVLLRTGALHASLRPGAGGLPIIYWTGEFTGTLPPRASHVSITDRVYADRRIGWKDIVVGNESEPTTALRRYPPDVIATPRRISEAGFTLRDGVVVAVEKAADRTTVITSSPTFFVRQTVLSDMMSQSDASVLFIALTLLMAFGLGALHALEPGHGKALLAFTLVGSRATVRQATILAGSLTFAHTIGVIVLGLVLFSAADFVSENVYPWITLLSGVAVAAIGARALSRAMQRRRRVHVHSHAHEHDHAHHAHHAHAHGIPGDRPLNFSSAVVAAMSGGIAPCPAAIVVLLAALRLHRVGYGLVLIVVFSLGLAAVLTALGIAVVRGASWLSRRSGYDRIAHYGPLVTASIISLAGALMVGQGLVQTNIAANTVVVAVAVVTAIATYSFGSSGFFLRAARQS